MSPLKIAAAVAGAALFTLSRIHTTLGSVELSLAPSFSGKAKVYIPLAGWEIEAPVFSAPYAIHAQPRRVSPRAVGRVNTIIEDLSNLVARGNRDKR